MINILNLSLAEFKDRLSKYGVEGFRASQVFHWIYKKGVMDFKKMVNLSETVRQAVAEHFEVAFPAVEATQVSREDGSRKILLRLEDDQLIETVTIPIKDRQTVCVSSQIGCKFRCSFCASGQKGFVRNCTTGEMIAQVLMAKSYSDSDCLTHVVFMGIGEPLDNYDELMRAIRIMNAKEGMEIGARRMTISTSGLVPKIQKLAKEGLQIELSVSLHAPNDKIRGLLMPINKKYPVKILIPACKQYAGATGRAISYEYVLIKGVNASRKDAEDLAKLLKASLCKVNLIPYNPIEEFPHAAPTYPETVLFQKILQDSRIPTTVRFSKGLDIKAACGQLRAGHEK